MQTAVGTSGPFFDQKTSCCSKKLALVLGVDLASFFYNLQITIISKFAITLSKL